MISTCSSRKNQIWIIWDIVVSTTDEWRKRSFWKHRVFGCRLKWHQYWWDNRITAAVSPPDTGGSRLHVVILPRDSGRGFCHDFTAGTVDGVTEWLFKSVFKMKRTINRNLLLLVQQVSPPTGHSENFTVTTFLEQVLLFLLLLSTKKIIPFVGQCTAQTISFSFCPVNKVLVFWFYQNIRI